MNSLWVIVTVRVNVRNETSNAQGCAEEHALRATKPLSERQSSAGGFSGGISSSLRSQAALRARHVLHSGSSFGNAGVHDANRGMLPLMPMRFFMSLENA